MGCGSSKSTGKDNVVIHQQISSGSKPNPITAPAPQPGTSTIVNGAGSHGSDSHQPNGDQHNANNHGNHQRVHEVKSQHTDSTSLSSPSSQENGEQRQGNRNHFDNEHADARLNAFGKLVDANGSRIWSHEYYEARKEAEMHAIERGKCFEASKLAYVENRKAEAKTLSEKGKQHGELMVKANERAASKILEPQKLSEPTTDAIDLHGLLLQEATDATRAFINSKIRDGKLDALTIVTGQGLHSDWIKGAVIKPAILQLLSDNKWQFEIDEKNPGSIRVRL